VIHRWMRAWPLLALAVALAGCGSSKVVASGNNLLHTLTVYSDLPLRGADAPLQESIRDGEKLANISGHVGKLSVSFESLNDASSSTGAWDSIGTAKSAAAASSDPSAIAYLGDFDSGATALSLSLTNESGMVQLSPSSPYVGLTDASAADQKGEPGRFYPSGTRTFARLVPNDVVQAADTVAFMTRLGVKRVFVVEDLGAPDVFNAAMAGSVAAAAPAAGIAVAGSQQLDTETNTQPLAYAHLAAAIAAAKPDAVFVGAAAGPGVEALWQELHLVAPNLKLFASSTLATPSFLATLGVSATSTYVASPMLELSQYPASARRVLRAYRARFHVAPTVYTLYGYEAMKRVLAAIAAARGQGGDRASVVWHFFHLGVRHSVIGTYSITPQGDTTLANFAGYRVSAAGKLVQLMRLG
jgi:branched-chain amino acid transport system substrate-binding protein